MRITTHAGSLRHWLLASAAAAVVVALVGLPAEHFAEQIVRLDAATGDPLGSISLSRPMGIAVRANGNLLVLSNNPGDSFEFTAAGTPLGVFAETTGSVRDQVFGPDGDLYVSSLTHGVQRFDGITGDPEGFFTTRTATSLAFRSSSAVPEPGALLLVALAGVGQAGLGRRQCASA